MHIYNARKIYEKKIRSYTIIEKRGNYMIQTHGGDVYRYPDMLDFSANINPLGTPAAVMEAAAESLKNIKNLCIIKCAYSHANDSLRERIK